MMQDKNEINRQNQYFQNRIFFYHDKTDLSTFQYCSEFTTPNDNQRLNLLIKELMTNHLKDETQSSSLADFLQKLPQICNNAIKRLKLKSREVVKQNEEKGLIFQVFTLILKQFIGFLSYIQSKTTFQTRKQQLYSNEVTFLVKWEEGSFIQSKQVRQGSKQDTNENISDMTTSKKMILMLGKSSKGSYLIQNVQDKKSNSINQQQGELLQNLLEQFLKNQKTALSLLKGKNGLYYLLYLNEVMGKGGFGQVCKGQSLTLTQTNEIQSCIWAIKWCKKNINQYKECGYSISQQRQHQILMQINKALKLRTHKGGKYIIELKEVIDQKDRKYIVYEHCQHNSLREVLSKRKLAFNKKNIFEIGLQMAEVLKLIHFDLIQNQQEFYSFSLTFSDDSEVRQDNESFERIINRDQQAKGIIHRDIKLNNILVKQYSSQHIVIKLIDWAFSKRAYTNLRLNKISCGTTQYQAPQFEERKKYNSKVDIWAFGAVMYELMMGKPLADKSRGKDAKKKFREYIDEMNFSHVKDELNSEQAKFWKELLLGTLNDNPDNRWSAREVHTHFQAFKHYSTFSIEDLVSLTNIKQAKSLILYHVYALSPQMKAKGRLVFKTFKQYSKLLAEAVEALTQRQIERKIGLEEEYIELGRNDYKLIGRESIVNLRTADLRLNEAIAFFQENLLDYRKQKQLINCIRYVIEEFRKTQ